MIARMDSDEYDVIIIGAGISGINFAYRLQTQIPDLSYTILEGRDVIGGTWDLFRYPGVRSDSDLHTFGFPWRPWTEQKAIADGSLILNYVKESAAMYGIDQRIKFKHQVDSANWSSKQQNWSINVIVDNEPRIFRSRFMLLCTGYYDYNEALPAVIPGIEDFAGEVVRPQFWPKDLNYAGKDIVVIGSGATAITLVPALSETASHVTMLQRSPTYLLARPSVDKFEVLMRKLFPDRLAEKLVRTRWLVMPFLFIRFARKFPGLAKYLLRAATVKQLPSSVEYDKHFKPAYNPFQQRICVSPDGDFFTSLRSGKASVVTGHVERVTANSIKLTDGQELHPDIIVAATGLKLQLGGGMKLTVDNAPFLVSEKFFWKGAMLQDLPNAAFVVGYVDASWTLGADATALLICRLLKQMRKESTMVVVPRLGPEERRKIKPVPLMRLTSTYVQKGRASMPKAANVAQWRARSSYFSDMWEAKFGDIKSGTEWA